MENNRYNFIERTNSPTEWYYFDKAFSKEELNKIDKDVATLEYVRATTFQSDIKDRKSSIKWIPQNEEWDWLYHKLMQLAVIANDEMWGFDLRSASQEIQYTEYNSNELGKYEWHQDIGPNEGSHRKISITVQLSDDIEYEGGDLCFWKGGPSLEENIEYAPKSAGNVVIFPSYLMHSVKPVTQGIRKSFVIWLGGNTFR
jgi:PKHD-type hydroxylase